MKYVILFLIVLFITSCTVVKKSHIFCVRDNVSNSQTFDKRCEKIWAEESAKDPDACKKKPEFEKDPYSHLGIPKEKITELYISWERCSARAEKIEKRCDALPPAKEDDIVVLSGGFELYHNGKPVAKNGEPLPLCSQCPKCNPITY